MAYTDGKIQTRPDNKCLQVGGIIIMDIYRIYGFTFS